ncbi:hypothetical protein CEXT_601321 [Caerostris extrusa]|uniref:Uncharacterized protein n=1 Tax=Caerostris extrusa TaxID=172846 RepID=A0AAV4MZX8_CAEEX|nr:hypothetical protein CEXT_601321 [Caerostris extrusa]
MSSSNAASTKTPSNFIEHTPTDASVNTLTYWGVGGRQLILKYPGDREAKRASHHPDRLKHSSDWIFIVGGRQLILKYPGDREAKRASHQLDCLKHPSDRIFIWFGDWTPRAFPPLAIVSFRLATQKYRNLIVNWKRFFSLHLQPGISFPGAEAYYDLITLR